MPVQTPDTHYESIPPNPAAWFTVDTSAGFQGVHRSTAQRNNVAPTAAPNNPSLTTAAVAVVNNYYALANPA